MKNLFLFYLIVALFSYCTPSSDLELAEIRLINKHGKLELLESLVTLQNKKDTLKRLELSYTFNKSNIRSCKSAVLQIDNRAFFQIFINDKLALERKSDSFFQDTLIASKKDSFLYSDTLPNYYFLNNFLLKKTLLSGKNMIIVKFLNPKYYKLKHHQTQLFLSGTNKNYPSNSPIKNLTPSSLPWISITAQEGIKDRPKSFATLSVRESSKTITENIKIEIRGNTSQSFKKKSFSFTVHSKSGNLKKVSLINLPKHEHWVLYGPYADKSLIRNVLAYNLWEKMGYYSPKTKFCELSINGFYQGVYVLCEKIRVDTNRLNLTAGCLLKIDRPKGAFFTSNITNKNAAKTIFEIKYPKINEISLSKKTQIQSFVHLFEESLFLSDKNSLNIFEIIDMSSFLDFLIINEFCKNIDAYRLSTYFQITRDNKIKMGPVWDFNFSFGLTNYLDGYKSSGFVYDNLDDVPFWWEKLNHNLFFKSALSRRWKELRASVLSNDAILEMISLSSSELDVAKENNFNKWRLLGQEEVWPNYYIGKSYSNEIEYLTLWSLERARWLDKKWLN